MTEKESAESSSAYANFNLGRSGERAFKRAVNEVSRNYGLTVIRPELLLVGALPDLPAREVFGSQGIKASIQKKLDTLLSRQPKPEGQYTPSADVLQRIPNNTREVLLYAAEQAQIAGRNIEAIDLLYGVIREGHNNGSAILNEVGFKLENVPGAQVAAQKIFQKEL